MHDFDNFLNSHIMDQSITGSLLPHVGPSPFLLLRSEDIPIRANLKTLEGPDSQKSGRVSTGGNSVSSGGGDTGPRGQMLGWVK